MQIIAKFDRDVMIKSVSCSKPRGLNLQQISSCIYEAALIHLIPF